MQFVNINNQKEIVIDANQIVFDVIDLEKTTDLKHIVFKEGIKAEYVFVVSKQADIKKTITVKDHAHAIIRFVIATQEKVKIDLEIQIGEEAIVSYEGLDIVSENSSIILNEVYRFTDTKSQGTFTHKVFALDEAKAQVQGRINVQDKAQKTDSQLDLTGYLLSEKSQINLVPELDIIANDVKASHSAKTEHIDADALFYLQSRGLSKKEAMKLFLEGMIMDYISSISHEDVRKYINILATNALIQRYE